MDRFKTIIHIEGRSVDDIMRLPCVKSVEKTAIIDIYKFRFFASLMAHPAPLQSAYTGNVLAEDHEGKWHVLREDDLKK